MEMSLVMRLGRQCRHLSS